MKIQILGTGCAKCKALGEAAEKTAKEMGLSYEFEKVTDVAQIVSFGVMTTPALVIDGKVACSGKIPSDAEMKAYLAKAQK